MNQQTSTTALSSTEWGKLGGFVLLLIGLYFFDPTLATFVGGGAILVIILKGIIPNVGQGG